jgi:hypothetical protein
VFNPVEGENIFYSVFLENELTFNRVTRVGNRFDAHDLGCADEVSPCIVETEHQLAGDAIRWSAQAESALGTGPRSDAFEFSTPGCEETDCFSVQVRSSVGITFSIDDEHFFSRGGGAGGGRGVCVAEITSSGEVIVATDRAPSCFDTWGQGEEALNALLARLDVVDPRSILLMGFGDDAGSVGRSEAAFNAYEGFGATLVRQTGFRDGWALISRNGIALREDIHIEPGTVFTTVAVRQVFDR